MMSHFHSTVKIKSINVFSWWDLVDLTDIYLVSTSHVHQYNYFLPIKKYKIKHKMEINKKKVSLFRSYFCQNKIFSFASLNPFIKR
ncbi:hypothetical protein FKM82_026262 [Ascaphus truei]